ncbi:MAG: hypothetical protein ABIK39_05000 [candidate division WOR-3 bacterium]
MLYSYSLDLSHYIDTERIFYGEGRGEVGIALHIPLKNYVAGSDPSTDYGLMVSITNHLINFLLYERARRGAEAWDYDPERAAEIYNVCGDNIATSGIIVYDKNYPAGPKLQVFLDKTFGLNEVAIRWKAQMVFDERLLADYEEYLKKTLRETVKR